VDDAVRLQRRAGLRRPHPPRDVQPHDHKLESDGIALRNGNQSYKSSLELTHVTLLARLCTVVTRPFAILFGEPIVTFFVTYLTLR
jgi:hypothetical protein